MVLNKLYTMNEVYIKQNPMLKFVLAIQIRHLLGITFEYSHVGGGINIKTAFHY